MKKSNIKIGASIFFDGVEYSISEFSVKEKTISVKAKKKNKNKKSKVGF